MQQLFWLTDLNLPPALGFVVCHQLPVATRRLLRILIKRITFVREAEANSPYKLALQRQIFELYYEAPAYTNVVYNLRVLARILTSTNVRSHFSPL